MCTSVFTIGSQVSPVVVSENLPHSGRIPEVGKTKENLFLLPVRDHGPDHFEHVCSTFLIPPSICTVYWDGVSRLRLERDTARAVFQTPNCASMRTWFRDGFHLSLSPLLSFLSMYLSIDVSSIQRESSFPYRCSRYRNINSFSKVAQDVPL